MTKATPTTISTPIASATDHPRPAAAQASLPFSARQAVPLVVSYGMGVDSTGMLVEMKRRGLVPDRIITADTGSDHPENYAYLGIIGPWLARVGFPAVEVVKNARPKSGDDSLGAALLRTQVLPALAYGQHQCSQVWKIDPIDKALRAAYGWSSKERTWAGGIAAVRKAIGYDAGPRDRVRAGKAHGKDSEGFVNWYPLIEWGFDRDALTDLILGERLPLPLKSRCFFCPAMRKEEIDDLGRRHPHLLKRAIQIEDGARERGLTSIKGLGRSWSWREYVELQAPADVRACL